MFEFSLTELSLIMVVALVLIGPEELPGVVRGFVNLSRKLRSTVKEFTNSIIEMDEIDSLKKEVKKLNDDIKTIVDMEGNLQETYDISDIMPELNKAKEERDSKQTSKQDVL